MSAQSIKENNIQVLGKEYDDKILANANRYILSKRFDLGKEPCKEEVTHNLYTLGVLYGSPIGMDKVKFYYMEGGKESTVTCKTEVLPSRKDCYTSVFSSEFSDEFE